MKYILKKKWHPSQVEEVGYEFEIDEDGGYTYTYSPFTKKLFTVLIEPHEIALLCEAGYLVKQEEVSSNYMQAAQIHECGHCNPHKGYELVEKYGFKCGCKCHDDTQLELWTELPPDGTEYWIVELWCGKVDVNSYICDGDIIDKFRVKTKNCHRTQKSAEEALKRLLEQE